MTVRKGHLPLAGITGHGGLLIELCIVNLPIRHGRAGEPRSGPVHRSECMAVPVAASDCHPVDYISYEIATPLGLTLQRTIEPRPVGSGSQIGNRIAGTSPTVLLHRCRVRNKVETLQAPLAEVCLQATTALPRLARAAAARPAVA